MKTLVLLFVVCCHLVASGTLVNAQDDDIINFGINPYKDVELLKASYKPLLEYLSEKTGRRFILNISPDYATLKQDLKEGRIQIARFSSALYGEALVEMPEAMKYLATVVQDEGGELKDHYVSRIIARKDAGMHSLADLQGKSFAFVSKSSGSGYKFPLALMLKAQIAPEKYFSSIFFLGGHDNVLDAVAAGQVDAGAVSAGSTYAQKVAEHGDVYQIIQETPPIPLDPYAASATLSDAFIAELQEMLINIPADAVTAKGERVFDPERSIFAGFTKRSPEFYNVIIETDRLVSEYEKSLPQ